MTPPRLPFPRTTCSCADCVRCCHDQPGSLAPGQLEAIAEYLQQPVRVAALSFWASPGALLANTQTGQTYRIGTITPRLKAGRCVFLSADDRCTIHAIAPAGCALFDTHMTAQEAHPRSLWLARAQAQPEYQSLRRTLRTAERSRPKSY
jgi:Fe-S-cluster containining protein